MKVFLIQMIMCCIFSLKGLAGFEGMISSVDLNVNQPYNIGDQLINEG
jgi:hypothetical protein